MIMRQAILLYVATIFLFLFKCEAFVINPFDIVSKPFDSLSGSFLNWNPFDGQDKSFVQPDENGQNETVVRRTYSYGCRCQNYDCGCCAHIEVEKMKLNDTGCLNMTYSNLDNIEVEFDLNGRVLYNQSISLVNPPDLCFPTGVPLAELCLKFYQLDARNKTFSGSVDLIAKFDGKQIARIKLGSFRFGNNTYFQEQNIMSLRLNKDTLVYSYGNETDKFDKFNLASQNLISQTYDNFLNNFEKLSLPQFSMDFQPETFFSNFFKSMFGSRSIQKQNEKTEKP